MRRFFVISLPIAVVALFIFIMHTDKFLKYPLGSSNDMPASIHAVMEDVKDEKWEEAEKSLEELASTWKKVSFRIQFSAELDEIDDMNVDIARLKGSVAARDKASALIELNEAYEHWESIGR